MESEEPPMPWTKEEFEQFNCIGRWTFDDHKTDITPFILDKDGPKQIENPDFKEFLSQEPKSSPTIKIFLTTGITGSATPVQMTLDNFSYWNARAGIPKRLLKIRANSDDMGHMEYLIERDKEGIAAISIVCDWAPYGDVYIWFIARRDFRTGTLTVLVSSKKPLDSEVIMGYLEDRQELLLEEPMHFIGLLLTAAGAWCRGRVSRNVKDLLEIEAEIGVTIDRDYFRSRSYRMDNDDFEDINARLFGEAKSIAIHRIYIDHLKDFSAILLDIMQNIKKQRSPHLFDSAQASWLGSEERGSYELEYLDKRMQSVMNNLEYSHTVSQTLFQVLYNRMLQRDARLNYRIARAAKQDSTAMRTISILTLTFLPWTAVSAVFSGTVFDFQNWGNADAHVSSPGWWVFALACILSTLVTVAAWWAWLYKSERKLDWEEAKEKEKEEEAEAEALAEAEEEKDEDEKGSIKSKSSRVSRLTNRSRQSVRSHRTGVSVRSRKSNHLTVDDAV
ncbi:hypothetical protein EJ04DRAFT_512852 [Polyplosphaeria fusca]|uniref:Uncharacterized protein n=1 Tax=Polyplosphaeria fusca TaxID=682080 RepID=A0A9P4QWG5_9PLEO|nr:hypothetical protein EJ04DRAFT_512852 [Polyplosphaeria fusca]